MTGLSGSSRASAGSSAQTGDYVRQDGSGRGTSRGAAIRRDAERARCSTSKDQLLERIRAKCDEKWRFKSCHANVHGELAVVVVGVIAHENEDQYRNR